jgi:hypothetical protein
LHRSIDRHGDIKNLGMPGMTLMFQVKDPAMLEKVKAEFVEVWGKLTARDAVGWQFGATGPLSSGPRFAAVKAPNPRHQQGETHGTPTVQLLH